jgi:formylglycine-generating enzyme required for sulfatase activity
MRIGLAMSPYHTVRGGSWFIDPLFARVADRCIDDPGRHERRLGFRLVRRMS